VPFKDTALISRRTLLKGLLAVSATGAVAGGYSVASAWRLNVTRYALTPPDWPKGLKLKLAVIADLHVCDPWMSIARVRQIVARTNALEPDAVLLLGDFVVGYRLAKFSRPIAHRDWAAVLTGLKAPLGVHAVLGNHDWWEERSVQDRRAGPVKAGEALKAEGIPVYENQCVRLEKNGQPFWLAGLGDQWAFWPKDENYEAFVRNGKVDYDGIHDLPGTLKQVTDDAPVILMAHEPDIFPQVPPRVALTLSGHTHGGQVRLAGFTPVVPSRFGSRYVYGHIVEDNRNLVVSGGLGCSGLPVRFGALPEVVVIELG
jgi:uncharacterized protein